MREALLGKDLPPMDTKLNAWSWPTAARATASRPLMPLNHRPMFGALASGTASPSTTRAAAAFQTSAVVVTPLLLSDAGAGQIGSGATLRHVPSRAKPACGQCAQPGRAIYRLHLHWTARLASGARTSAIKGPLEAGLSHADMRDLAADLLRLCRPCLDTQRGGSKRCQRRADAQHRVLRRLPWRAGQQGL
jgi:hypothetical protein